MTDLLGGHVDMMFDNLTNALPQIRDGKVKALAVASAARIGGIARRARDRRAVPRLLFDQLVCDRRPAENPPDVAAQCRRPSRRRSSCRT